MEPLEVYGQENVRELIDRSIRSGLFGNSILLEGPFGVGKDRMAFWLAQVILCESGKGCGGCVPCKKVVRLTHPDLKWMVPAPGSDAAPVEEDSTGTRNRKQTEREKFIVSAMASRRDEPFFVPRSSRPLGHSAESIRELLSWCSKKPYEADRKVVIIRDADMMAPGIANLFLKLLEEPPLDTVLILTSAMPHRLLSTVLSRCSSYRLQLVDDQHIKSALREYRGVEGEKASLLTGLAQGSLLRAVELVDRDDELRAEALKLFGIAAVGRIRECYDFLIESLSNRYGRNRSELLDRTLFFMVLVLRDLLILEEGSDESAIVNADLMDKMRKLGGKWEKSRLVELILELEKIRRDLRYNVNPDLALWKALDSVRAGLHEGQVLTK
jgi:DNA polymerase-3 subunit delta'